MLMSMKTNVNFSFQAILGRYLHLKFGVLKREELLKIKQGIHNKTCQGKKGQRFPCSLIALGTVGV